MKQEIRIELTENRLLDNIIKKCYFEDDNLGKIKVCMIINNIRQ